MENCVGDKPQINDQIKFFDTDDLRAQGLNLPDSKRCVRAQLSHTTLKKINSARIEEKAKTVKAKLTTKLDDKTIIQKIKDLVTEAKRLYMQVKFS